MRWLSPSNALQVLGDDRRARSDFVSSVARLVQDPDWPKAGELLLMTIVFDHDASEEQVDIAVKICNEKAVSNLVDGVTGGFLRYQGEFAEVENVGEAAGVPTQKRLVALAGWKNRYAVIRISLDLGHNRLGVEIQ